MQAAVIIGPRKSGKTTLLSLVAEELERRGKTVAAVKYSHHSLEQENTDAFWLRRPGRAVVNVAPGETVVFWPEELSFERIASQMDADVLLLEGGDAPSRVPRILCLPEESSEAESYVKENAGCPIMASVGGPVAAGRAPHFREADPASAEKLATLILERGAAV
ncbi:MAG: molybdopterin-guanine dinucleotide biosynthesis protein MobB [Deltaproteobacteria bacterium]|nr:molybdopterin-guanine dinucleotide biosynthesis protein MobB [Deltaproteobacteria bacterium]